MSKPSDPPQAPLAQPPRSLSAATLKRTWQEPHVRLAWMAAAVAVLALLYVFAQAVMDWRSANRLLTAGVDVQATAFASGRKEHNRLIKSDYLLDIFYTYNGVEHKQVSKIDGAESLSLRTGVPFTVRIDPDAPDRWAMNVKELPLYTRLVGTYILAATALVAGGYAILRRALLISLLKNGEQIQAVVASLGQSALAPRSTVVHCHLSKGARQMWHVFLPPHVPAPEVGGSIRLICGENGSGQCVAADAYFA